MAKEAKKPIVTLIAEDDEDFLFLAKEAFQRFETVTDLRSVADGEELMDYLFHRGKYQNPEAAPRPGIILLDLNMPRKDGREALKEIKSHPELRQIPVVVLTTSRDDEDVLRCHDLGANAFIRKPIGFNRLVEVIKGFQQFWFEIAELPAKSAAEKAGQRPI